LLERIFHLRENNTNVRIELLAGLTTFMTMAYIVVVNPQILAEAGMPVDGVLFATCLSAAIATLIMGLWANYPIALAPGMSLNAYFTYSIVIGRGIPWQTVLGVVFLSGVLFLLLTLTSIREQIVNSIPDCLKHGTAAGIGLFIAFIGLRNAKIIVANRATFVGLGHVSDPHRRVVDGGNHDRGEVVDRRGSDFAEHALVRHSLLARLGSRELLPQQHRPVERDGNQEQRHLVLPGNPDISQIAGGNRIRDDITKTGTQTAVKLVVGGT